MQVRLPIHEQLRHAREARGEDLAALAARVGMREHVLRAIDEGRFDDLPAGIYGRAAIRAYAGAVGRDPAEVLAACEPSLRPLEDPVATLAVCYGVGGRSRQPGASPRTRSDPEHAHFRPGGGSAARRLAAAAIDAAIVTLALMAAIAATAVLCRLPASALGSGAPAGFALMGLMLAITYFACVSGIAGATLGEQLARARTAVPGPITIRELASRAARGATIDARVIVEAGASLGARVARMRVTTL